MLLKGSTASTDTPIQTAKVVGKFLRLVGHHASAEWPGVETEIPQKKHGQGEQKFLPIVFHVQDIQ
jgi:hypothetical protein